MTQAEERHSGPLSIVLSCPKCGAPFTVDDEAAGARCDHCSSRLILSAPERDEIYAADGRVASAEDVLEIVILYRVQSYRAEIVTRHQSEDGNPPPEAFIQARLRAFEERLRRVASVLEARRLQVPYWHITGKIIQAILGRHKDGPKTVRLRAFAVEHTVPGYDTAKANLRDRGLRLARAKVRPLTVRDVRQQGPFLPWVPVADRQYREIEKWRGRDLDLGTEPVTKHCEFLFGRRLLVYRPYWLARVTTDAGQQWVLADSSFATIAGYPDELESRSLTALGIEDPLHSGEESYRRVHAVPSRCPDCGFEEALDRRYRIALCSNCHLALLPEPGGIRVVPYSHAGRGKASLDGDYVPFWRYELSIQLPGGKAVDRLEDYAKALFPQGPPAGFQPAGRHLWVPAVRLLGTERGDEAFRSLVEWTHGARLSVELGKIPVGGQPSLWGVSLPEEEARALGRFVLFGIHDKPSAARLTTLLVRKAIEQARITLSVPRLVMVPFDREGEEVSIQGTGVRLPLLLLLGGPELDAQRATVHASKELTP